MRYPCHYKCSCSFDYEEERSRHENVCPKRLVSCCQSSSSCQREVKDWIATEHSCLQNEQKLVLCRHESNGLFGAIREDNLDLVQYFLQELKDNLVKIFTHESRFGDTILTFAASLGRYDIVQVLVTTIRSIGYQNNTIAISDLIEHETSRGKMPIIEAVKNDNAGVVSILLSHQANSKILSKIHKKSALDWAIALGNEPIAKMIDEHTRLEDHVCSLFKAVSKFDIRRMKVLTDGGTPFQQDQDAVFQRKLELKRCQVDLATQNAHEILLDLEQGERSKAQLHSVIHEREKHIESMLKKREAIVFSRRSEVTAVTAKVRFAVTITNTAHVCNMTNPPKEYELMSKALCTLLHIKVKKNQGERPEREQLNAVYWGAIKSILKDNIRFYHRIRHYHFEIQSVELAANEKVDGLPGTCFDHLSSSLNKTSQNVKNDHPQLGSVIMTSIAYWLWAIFQSLPGHKLENDLVMEESTERGLLERNRIDYSVIISRNAILKRELDQLKTGTGTVTAQISQLQKKLGVSKVMRYVAGGHSILSWAAGVGNRDILKLLLKRGAHTPVGDDLFAWCATIIQVTFRHHVRREKLREALSVQERNERMGYDLAVSLRVKSLSKLVRERLKSLHLPLVEALFNGHSEVVPMLEGTDIPIYQAMNLFPLFCHPSGMIPKLDGKIETSNELLPSNGSELLSSILAAGQNYSHQHDPQKCVFTDSLKCTIKLFEGFLKQRRNKMEAKISKRRETLSRKHKNAMASEMRSAIYRGDFVAIVKASEEGGISLDFEDNTTGMTPLIRAALLPDIHSPMHEWYTNSMGEQITAAAFLLDRISPHRPSADYENQLGHTALAMACINGRLKVVEDLIDRGADVERQSSVLNCTAYDLAVREKQFGVVEFLDQLKVRRE